MKSLVTLLMAFSLNGHCGSVLYYGFTEDENAFLNQVMGHVWRHLISAETIACTQRVARYEPTSPTIGENVYSNFRNDGTLFQSQMPVLRNASSGKVFPDVDIHAYDEEDFSWGRADYDLLKIYTNEYKGSFRITLNQHQMRQNRSVAAWAGLVAHEMLHNLSHAHPSAAEVGLEVAYDDDYLINAYQNCVTYGGNYRGNNVAITYRCGGRETR